jgi:hypothetical protein
MAAAALDSYPTVPNLFPSELKVLKGMLLAARDCLNPAKVIKSVFLSAFCDLAFTYETLWCRLCNYILGRLHSYSPEVQDQIRGFCSDMDRAILSSRITAQEVCTFFQDPRHPSLKPDFDENYNFAALRARIRDALLLFGIPPV